MIYKLATVLKRTLPLFLYNGLANIFKFVRFLFQPIALLIFNFQLRKIKKNHRKALEKVREKERINVAFLLIHESVWKYDELYKLMVNDSRYNPIVFVCPYTVYSDDIMFKELNRTYKSFQNQDYRTVSTLNSDTGEWLDIKTSFKPDLVMFTNPWNLTKPQYLVTNFLDTLTCYVPYGFKNSYLYQSHFNGKMQNLTWKFFLETKIHKKLSKNIALNKSYNTVVTGYPGLDKLLHKNYIPNDVWKIKDRSIKRIIWAPHHTIPGYGATLDYSTFLEYADFMLEMAAKYMEKIQIAFKPHPVLRAKLSKPEVWGKHKTDKYYNTWSELENGQLEEGGYIDLFLTSDGMIHDSSSFVIEYLYTSKPVMFLSQQNNIIEKFNEVGKIAFNTLYHGKTAQEIEEFINNVIISEKDAKYEERLEVFNTIIRPPNNLTASQNIFNYLNKEFINEKK